jgi:hypothetical protein
MACADRRATDRTCLESAPTAVSRLIRVVAYFYCLRSGASHTTRLRQSRGVNYGVIRSITLVFNIRRLSVIAWSRIVRGIDDSQSPIPPLAQYRVNQARL